jgi:signal transduction histidine kinase
LIANEKVVGVLEVLNKRKGDFTQEDQEVLTALGSQAAVAIENARLFQQSDLVAELVHELRTPLASLSTATHLLLRPEISEEQRRKMAQTIQVEANRLSEMATSYLDLARLESGRSQFKVGKVDLTNVLEEAVAIMRGRIEEKGIHLEMALPDSLPIISGDRDKIKQVALNLMSNAIKYNRPDGSITISAGEKDEYLTFSVKDTGFGILPEHTTSLFQKFYRVPGSEQIAQGTGLGLSICKKIIEGHGGSIEVDSSMGQGTQFSVFLPLYSDEAT